MTTGSNPLKMAKSWVRSASFLSPSLQDFMALHRTMHLAQSKYPRGVHFTSAPTHKPIEHRLAHETCPINFEIIFNIIFESQNKNELI